MFTNQIIELYEEFTGVELITKVKELLEHYHPDETSYRIAPFWCYDPFYKVFYDNYDPILFDIICLTLDEGLDVNKIYITSGCEPYSFIKMCTDNTYAMKLLDYIIDSDISIELSELSCSSMNEDEILHLVKKLGNSGHELGKDFMYHVLVQCGINSDEMIDYLNDINMDLNFDMDIMEEIFDEDLVTIKFISSLNNETREKLFKSEYEKIYNTMALYKSGKRKRAS